MRISRRTALMAAGAATLGDWVGADAQEQPGADNSLWYRRPARAWLEALPVGNGRLAADRPASLSFTARYETPHVSSKASRDGNTLTLTGAGGSAQGIAGAVRFAAAAQFLADGGEVRADDPETLSVVRSDAVTIL